MSTLYQHWTRPRGPGTKAVAVVYCERHHEEMKRLWEQGHGGLDRHIVRLSPSAARKSFCLTCGRKPGRAA